MPEKIDSADKATKVAVAFMKKYYGYAWPIGATREQETWLVEVDVGVVKTKVARVRVNVNTSSIVDYSVPTETSPRA